MGIDSRDYWGSATVSSRVGGINGSAFGAE